ncbi:MAG: WD40 repeat domain-containing protein [Candidatus Acidiferrales bacterium]
MVLMVAFVCGPLFGVRHRPVQQSMKLARIYKLLPKNGAMGAALSQDGRYVAIQSVWGDMTSTGEMNTVIDRIELWDVSREQRVADRQLASWPPCNKCKSIPMGQGDDRFTRFSNDGSKILAFDGFDIQLLDAHNLSLIRKVELHLPVVPVDSHANLEISEVELSADGSNAAVMLSGEHGGTVRIYDTANGSLVRKWEYEGLKVGRTGRRMAWSPNGQYVALTTYPVVPGQHVPEGAKNVLIFYAHTGQLVQAIHTDYVAGPVAFASENLLLTASLDPAFGRSRKDAIEEWDVRSGKIVREFTSFPFGPRYQLAVSGDRRILVGFVTTEHLAEHFVRESDEKFEVWNLITGQTSYTSDTLDFPQPVATRMLQVETNANGNRILVRYQESTTQPLLVYDLNPSN